jgi:8-amino-7-oxononanoate synthase
VLDFTSALYLGMRHPAGSLPPWDALTEGRPAALGETAGARAVARQLAALMGFAEAALFASTLHLFVDLLDTLARAPTVLFTDAHLYPAARWPIERAAGLGVEVHTFDRHHPADLARALARARGERRPVVVTTGLCPGCGGLDQVPALLQVTEAAGGHLVVDDTQALGILGPRGGGTARALGLRSPQLVVGASLAKGFGVPLAVLAGPASVVQQVADLGPTRWHASPPSAAVIAAGASALTINARGGDRLRARLSAMALRLGAGLVRLGLGAGRPVALPVQSSRALPRAFALGLHEACAARGLRCLVQRAGRADQAVLTFLVTAAHDESDIDEALQILAHAQTAQARVVTPAEVAP